MEKIICKQRSSLSEYGNVADFLMKIIVYKIICGVGIYTF